LERTLGRKRGRRVDREREKITGVQRKSRNEEFHNLNFSTNILG
jgi:hypothetical protein